MNTKFLGRLGTIAVGLAFAAGAAAQTTLKLGHILPPTSPEHQAFIFFSGKVKEKTGGSVALEVFPSSQLGAVNVMLESLQAGQLDMLQDLAPADASKVRADGKLRLVTTPGLGDRKSVV